MSEAEWMSHTDDLKEEIQRLREVSRPVNFEQWAIEHSCEDIVDAISMLLDTFKFDVDREVLFMRLRKRWCFACGGEQPEGGCMCEREPERNQEG